MKHIEISDIILFALDRKQLIEDLETKQRHVDSCENCQQQIKQHKTSLENLQQQNEKTCREVIDKLIQLLKNDQCDNLPTDIKDHLNECESCGTLYSFCQNSLTLDDTDQIDIEIPQEILNRIDEKIYDALDQLQFEQAEEKEKYTPTTVFKKQKTKVRTIGVQIIPALNPALVRGNNDRKLPFFEHDGGTLKLKTGEKHTKVSLYAIFEDKTFEQLTDELGYVIFEDLPADDYQININGYEVKNIKDLIV